MNAAYDAFQQPEALLSKRARDLRAYLCTALRTCVYTVYTVVTGEWHERGAEDKRRQTLGHSGAHVQRVLLRAAFVYRVLLRAAFV